MKYQVFTKHLPESIVELEKRIKSHGHDVGLSEWRTLSSDRRDQYYDLLVQWSDKLAILKGWLDSYTRRSNFVEELVKTGPKTDFWQQPKRKKTKKKGT